METFVVRVWRAADQEPGNPDAWTAHFHGLVEHVGTGTTARFGGGEELLTFLRRSPMPSEPRETGASMPEQGGDT